MKTRQFPISLTDEKIQEFKQEAASLGISVSSLLKLKIDNKLINSGGKT